MDATKLLLTLRAVRRFSPDLIPDPVLLDVLEVCRWTGSAKNTQPWELIVLRNAETLKRLAPLAPFGQHLAGAQAGIALVMPEGRGGFDEGRLAQNLMLAAWAHGVGSCIASIYPEESRREAAEILCIPEGLQVRTVISLGYPADSRARSLRAAAAGVGATPMIPVGRKSLTDLVSWERYGRSDMPS